MSRENKKSGRFLGPLVITGITAGVLYSAYKAIFKQPEYQTTFTDNENSSFEPSSEQPKDITVSVDHTPSTENVSHEESKSSSETATTNSNDATNN